MHTRLLTFTGAKNIDGGVEFLRQKVVPILNEQEGYRGITASADRSGGVLGILSLWDGRPGLAKARQEFLDLVGGELSVETFEQLLAETNEAPRPGSSLMVTRIGMDPATIDENVAFYRSEILPRIRANAAFQAVRSMINRKTGQGLVGTVWANPDAMKAAAKEAQSRRQEAIARGVSLGDVSYREILFSNLR